MPRLGQRVSDGEPAAEQPARLGVREVDDEILVDRQDSLLQPLEQEAKTIALGLEAPERAAQLPPHPVEVVASRPNSSRNRYVSGVSKSPLGDSLRRRAEAAQAQCDQLREEEPDDDPDDACDHACAERLAVDRVDRFGRRRLPADGDEHSAVVRNRGVERPSVGSSSAEVVPCQRCPSQRRARGPATRPGLRPRRRAGVSRSTPWRGGAGSSASRRSSPPSARP